MSLCVRLAPGAALAAPRSDGILSHFSEKLSLHRQGWPAASIQLARSHFHELFYHRL